MIKANIVKLVDGNFIESVRKSGEEYPEIEIQERLVEAMSAKMLDAEFNKGIEVVVLPNLYGDIVTDVAAEHQGGLGTTSSSDISNKYAMFEAIHGTVDLSDAEVVILLCGGQLAYTKSQLSQPGALAN